MQSHAKVVSIKKKYAVTFLEAVYIVTFQSQVFCELFLKHGAFVYVWCCPFDSSIGRNSPFNVSGLGDPLPQRMYLYIVVLV